jgi:hypothetical protein
MWGALSDERTGLSFTIATGCCQRSHSLVRAPLDSRPYFTVSDLRLPISSPPTTRRVTVDLFDPASTRVIRVVSFTPRPLYTGGKRSRYPLERRLGESQSRSGHRGEENVPDPTGNRHPTPSVVQQVTSRYTDSAYVTYRILLSLLFNSI